MLMRLIDRLDTFQELKEAWNELALQSPDDHAFMRHEWFEQWLLSQEMTGRLHMITGWRDGQLVGVLPLVWRDVKLRRLRFRALRFAESAISPRCNALALDAESLQPLITCLASERRCQLVELHHLEEQSPTTQTLITHMRQTRFFLVGVTPGRQSPYLRIESSWDDYLAAQSSHRRYWIRNIIRKMEGQGWNVEVRRATEATEAAEFVDVMLDVSGRSWKAQRGSAVGQVASQQRLFRGFTGPGLQRGLVEASVLWLDGKPVAFDYLLRCRNHYTGIRSDFDEAYRRHSPGEYLRIAFVRRLCDAGVPAQVDLGGVTADYKQRWTDRVRSHVIIHAARALSSGAVVVWWKQRRPSLVLPPAAGA